MWLCCCRPGSEGLLLAELGAALPRSLHQAAAPGLIRSELAPEDAELQPVLASARQCLPGAELLEASSVSGWVAAAGERLLERLATHQGPWRLHVFALEGGAVSPGRAALIEEGLGELLRRKQRRLVRTRSPEPGAPWAPGEALVQLLLVEPESGAMSVALEPERLRLRHCLSRFPGGAVDVPRDPAPPSRAYRKLLEAELRLGRSIAPGESCVDLGAAPGGWSHVALQRGALVTAVDRSALRDDLMRHPGLTFVRGDAFAWEPPQPVDWLLCDVIAFPDRSLALLTRWLSAGLCRRFVVTVKLRGEVELPLLARLEELLERHAAEWELRQLDANKHEVTAYGAGRVAPPAGRRGATASD